VRELATLRAHRAAVRDSIRDDARSLDAQHLNDETQGLGATAST
jgi:hypothetical protein